VLLDRYWDSCLDATYDLRETLRELRSYFFSHLALVILLIRHHNVLDCCFISNSVNVQDALITLRDNRLVRDQL
jgi:hypothetical protein